MLLIQCYNILVQLGASNAWLADTRRSIYILTDDTLTRSIVILCPDHHRIVHKAKAIFNYELHQFGYENARIDPLMYNLHL